MQKVLNHFSSLLLFAFIFLNALSVFAGPGRTTYQAKIVKPDGYPLEATSVNFKFTILDPAGSCIVYSETYSSVNMSSTGGLISFSLGSGVKTYPASATTFEQVFSNITPSLSCDTGGPANYSPTATDTRKIVMQFHDGTGWQTLPAMNINAVPYAMYANEATKLNGLQASDFVQLSTVPTCATSEALRYTGAGFTCVAVGSSVTSGTVISALGYTPADGASVTTLTSNVSSVSSTVASVSSTVFSVSSTVTSLQNSVAASFAAITSSQWTTSGTNIFYNTGNIGIGITTPVTKLDVSGGVRIGGESTTCAPALAGTLRYNATNVEYCNGTSWQAFGVSGAGITNFNGSTSGTQTFATGTGGTAPAFNTSNGVHTLNIPNASTGSVTAGLISNADYTTFTNKITSSAASIAQVLGYVPADNAASGTYAQKANNLSDLTNIATARTNLGLGTFATASSIDLGSASATGTLAIARLPSFTGDATIAAASNTIILSNSGVTAGTYTKVTVDTKGRVTSGTQITSSDVTTALGYTPANSATTVSSQWSTSGTTINYMAGNVGIGTVNPGNSRAEIFSQGVTNDKVLKVTGSGVTGGQTGPFYGVYVDAPANNNATARYGIYADGNGGGSGSNYGVYGTTTMGSSTRLAVGVQGHVLVNSAAVNNAPTMPTPVAGVMATASTTGISMNAVTTALLARNETVYGAISYGAYIDAVAGPTTVIPLRIDYNTSEIMRVTSSGNVGIGTTVPTAKLHLAAGTSSTASFKFTSGTLLTSPQSGTIEYDGTNFYLTDSTNTRRAIAANTNPGTYDNVSNINSSSNITLTPTGSVVVSSTTASTNSSTGALIVKGGMGVAGDLNVAGIISGSAVIKATGYRANQGAPDAADSSTVGYAFGTDGDTGLFSPGSGSANGVLTFYSNNSEKMRLTSGGALGIGTTNPGAKLAVGGDIFGSGSQNGTAGLYLYRDMAASTTGTTAYGLRYTDRISTDNNHKLSLVTQGSDRLIVDSSGNVGIGTSTPSYPLDVKNQIRVGAQGGSDVSILNGGSGYGANLDLYNASGTLTTKISANNNSYFNFGSVGIGTTGPVAKLDIKGTRQNSITTSNAIFKFGGDDVFLYGGAHDGIGGPNYPIMLQAMRDSDSLTFPLVLNPNGGNVGIGTLTPGYALSVYRGTASVTTNNESGSAGSAAQNRYAGLTAGSVAQVYGAGLNISNGNGGYEIYDYTAGASRMFISTAGSIGIGTTSPSTALDVGGLISTGVGTTQIGGVLGNNRGVVPNTGLIVAGNTGSSNGGYAQFYGSNAVSGTDDRRGNVDIGSYSSGGTPGNINFYTYNGSSWLSRMMIQGTTGNVGIGTTSPAQKLDVVGTIRSGNNTAVQGSVLLMDAYTNGSLTNLGTEYSSGGPMLGYGVTPSTVSAATFLSATPISLARSAMNMSDSIRFYTGAAQTVSTGSSVSLSEAMRITNTGVGIGTTSPGAKFEVSRNFNGESNTTAAFIGGYDSGYTNTGAYFVQKDNTGLGSANTSLFNVVKNGTSQFSVNGAGDAFIGTDVVGTGYGKALWFKGVEVSTDSMWMAKYVSATDISYLRVNIGDETSDYFVVGTSVGGVPGGAWTNSFWVKTDGSAWLAGTLTQASDARFKKNVRPLEHSLEKILRLEGVTYNWIDPRKPASTQVGLIAQEVEKVYPELVANNEDGYKSVAYQNLVAPMINAIKELYVKIVTLFDRTEKQSRQIANLEAENAKLKESDKDKDQKIKDLEARMQRIEKALNQK